MPSLDDLYELYCGVASDLNTLRVDGPRQAALQAKADQLWLDYTNQGGGRELWHRTDVAWQYHDGFVEMRHSSADGPVDQLRQLLNLPRNVGPHYMGTEQSAVERFQRSHYLPVTGAVDRRTWQALLAERGERKASILPRVLELPGNAEAPVPIVIRTRKHWVLALDDVEERTYANHYNLALLAVLAYADMSAEDNHIREQMVAQWNHPRLLEDVFVWDNKPEKGGKPWRMLVREDRTQSRGKYEYAQLTDDATDTQGFILNHPLHCVIALRGTEMNYGSVDDLKAAIADLNSDLQAASQRWMYDGSLDEQGRGAGKLGLQVHKGFYRAFDSVRPQLADRLRTFLADNPHKPIFVTGHSLGGGIATLAACYLRSHREFGRNPIQLYTFAQPRVGTRQFAEHYWTQFGRWAGYPSFRYFRTAHLFDFITMIPNQYLADNVADVADVLIDAGTAMASSTGPIQWTLRQVAAEAGKAWLRERLNEQAPPVDYRHFGVPVLCVQDRFEHPHVVEELASQRAVEDGSIPRLQTVHEARDAARNAKVERVWDHLWHVARHMMGSYMRHSLHQFEHQADGYLRCQDVFPPFAVPDLAALQRELFHRFLHQVQHVEAHSYEQLRRSPA